MTYPKELQDYYDAHDWYIDHTVGEKRHGYLSRDSSWAQAYGLYKIARYNAVKAGYLPEKPEFE